jgi:hypothetical protein
MRMAWQSSFGATVLLALVALHSSTLIGLVSPEPVQLDENPDRLKQTDISPPVERVRSMLEEMLRLDHSIKVDEEMLKSMPSYWDEMLSLWQEDETKCGEDFSSLAHKWHRWADVTLRYEILDAIVMWEGVCYSRLEDKIQSELQSDAITELTREHFGLFAEQDERECRSEGRFECMLFRISNSVIGKLRRLIG